MCFRYLIFDSMEEWKDNYGTKSPSGTKTNLGTLQYNQNYISITKIVACKLIQVYISRFAVWSNYQFSSRALLCIFLLLDGLRYLHYIQSSSKKFADCICSCTSYCWNFMKIGEKWNSGLDTFRFDQYN